MLEKIDGFVVDTEAPDLAVGSGLPSWSLSFPLSNLTPNTHLQYGCLSNMAVAKLFTPLKIANGTIELQHRVILAPMTRNRGVPLSEGTEETPNRIWLADDLVALYYSQRASRGGLLITEGIPPSLEASPSAARPSWICSCSLG